MGWVTAGDYEVALDGGPRLAGRTYLSTFTATRCIDLWLGMA